MGRNDEISIPKCCNYTDLRPKNEVSTIEKETIQNYARGLKPEEMKIFLAEVKDEDLVMALHIRLMERQRRIDDAKIDLCS